ncbi:MAG: [protein-PII] uridylyltransferase [Nitrospiraceae bacterium]|nr:[protein-PII] uridylyltransferase [Nitrospiraceae bacterium]
MASDIKNALIDQAQRLLTGGASGVYSANQLSLFVDASLIEIFTGQLANSTLRNRDNDEIALVAVGGYGRNELVPFSDIDIMILANKRSLWVEDASQKVLYALWDSGLAISHSFRTLSESLEDGLSDIKTRTSLMEARFIAGSRRLFDEFVTDIGQKILFRNRKDFISEQLRDIFKRHRIYGDSVYLLQPNVKEGIGGLRDAHSALWLARTGLKAQRGDELKNLLAPHYYRHFRLAYDFMLRARISLHISSARKNEVLSYDMQKSVAGLMGFSGTRRFRPEEILMRLYYREARKIVDSLKTVSAAAGNAAGYRKAAFFVKRVSDNYLVSGNEIVAKDASALRDTATIMEAFHVFSITGKKFSQALREAIRSRLLFINKKTRYSKRARQYFLEILRGNRVYETLSEMHNIAILDRYIPEFGRLRHLVVYEPYHRYTVDEHTLIAIKNLEDLKLTKQPALSFLADLLRSVKQETLYLAVLLHDIGKGGSKRHEEEGYKMIRSVTDRFDLNVEDRQLIGFLIKNHILLSRLALHRDISSPETIAQLAGNVVDPKNLAALYLMTYADMSAVNPEFWSEWKASLLHSLYTKTLEHLNGAVPAEYPESGSRLNGFVNDMPKRYLISSTKDDVARDLCLVEKMRGSGDSEIDFLSRGDGTALLTIIAMDKPGIFSRIVRALSSNGLNVASAKLFTGRSGVVIDKIVISNWDELWWEDMEEDVERDLRLNLGAESGLQPVELRFSTGSRHSLFETFIEIDNESSAISTIVECFSADRIGLLYDIASTFHKTGVNIISAVINTEDGIAQDVFYLQYNDRKLSSDKIMEVLRELHAII